MSQIQKYLFITFIIPKFLKFCIQLNINPIESTMVQNEFFSIFGQNDLIFYFILIQGHLIVYFNILSPSMV